MRALTLLLLFLISSPLIAEESLHTIQFQHVAASELVRFVGKSCGINFLFNEKDLNFTVTLSGVQPMNGSELKDALVQLLRVHGFLVKKEGSCHVIYACNDAEGAFLSSEREIHPRRFQVYKLQYHQGNEIQEALKKVASDIRQDPDTDPRLLKAIDSVQWIKTTNSLLFSADEETIDSVKDLLASLDVALRQVFIEVLVVETDAHKSSDFGLQWTSGGRIQNRIGFGAGSYPSGKSPAPFAEGQIPLGSGFDLGVIGDLLLHKGKSYLSLGALVSALQTDGESSIVLNQKIITQDNKNSKIFVGDNIPYTGSVVQTVGQSQQTTANIEYRDIGVALSITPMLGPEDIITLDIEEEISESLGNPPPEAQVHGIRTTKTNMKTQVHVPDKHFLVLSGMVRNAKAHTVEGVPVLKEIPWVGGLFRKTVKQDEKRSMLIFVRPHIIHSFETYRELSSQENVAMP